MNIEKQMIETYLAAAVQVIGDRTPSEIAYDDAVVDGLNDGLSVELALARAGQLHPAEALQVSKDNIREITARYEYLREHAKVMHLIRKRKKR